MTVVGEVAQVVHAQVDQAQLTRLADQREIQRREVLREDGDDVQPHDTTHSPILTAHSGPADLPAGRARPGRPRCRPRARSPSQTEPGPAGRRSAEGPRGPGPGVTPG